ncbi:SPFH domain-containing protein [Streptomonospora nanhaiensis]|uniref:Regulator of protease activity HflC (Stomatin/prohibitin superfamily) n=1 Tax=Streptomonospora nanhaiensis TaxID=1323731 RepID=A0A853BTY7_9ACTN|nr:SPFH domain-containing protein [Streptomonospora nanhaiensis]MBV2365479.1 SPFH/Band 7/PHB domain protein [Streptomonospora nanhaiensis]MBX9391167.1 SPFH/Band 7/PHB domain protein [Streptomonospora nanhaiensis]NYI98424.1 regulator of protease activity HflC (stomatin/prohibitin superfamily) [Streptomonospora nanhaiensis]
MALNILFAAVAVLVVLAVVSTVRIVPQARAYNIERFGRYMRTLQPGLNFIIPVVDRVNTKYDLREQVFSSRPKPVITEDNLVVNIDTVLYYQITDPRAAAYEVADYLQAIDQLTVTTLRNVIGGMDLERTLTSREEINTRLRGVLDDATGKWGIRVNRVEIKAIDPPPSIKEAMEKQMRAERDKRAVILHAEGERQSRILTAEGARQQAILEAQGEQQARILRADGEAQAIERVFQAVHANNADPKLLAYKYLEVLPSLAKGEGNTFWVIPGELSQAVQSVTKAFSGDTGAEAPRPAADESGEQQPTPEITSGPARDDALRAADHAAEIAAEAVASARKEAEAAARPPGAVPDQRGREE